MEVFRTYKNSADETLRIDEIHMVLSGGTLSRTKEELTYKRQIKTTLLSEGIDRVVDSISLITDADVIDFNPSVANNYSFVEWDRSRTIRCGMTDLPVIGDTV